MELVSRDVVLRVLDLDPVCDIVANHDAIEIMVGFGPLGVFPSLSVSRMSREAMAAQRSIEHQLTMSSNGVGKVGIKHPLKKPLFCCDFAAYVAMLWVSIEVHRIATNDLLKSLKMLALCQFQECFAGDPMKELALK